MTHTKTVVVLGASPKTDRISHQAVTELSSHGYKVIPVHPVAKEINGLSVKASLSDISEAVDTVTVYMNAQRSSGVEQDLLDLKPRRVIFNPGAENPELASTLEEQGIAVEEACTLILLRTDQF
ncbi:CoA-binding protein [Kiritimatiellota bacterium B12222]|nr:CoA-binding protein [Kiritimatiellota bacterium B12222]